MLSKHNKEHRHQLQMVTVFDFFKGILNEDNKVKRSDYYQIKHATRRVEHNI